MLVVGSFLRKDHPLFPQRLRQAARTGAKLSEYHTGYRAFSRETLEALPLLANSDDFVFDNQMLVQAIARGIPIGEISCPTRYEPESSSIGFGRSVRYGLGVVRTTLAFVAWRLKIAHPAFLDFKAPRYLRDAPAQP